MSSVENQQHSLSAAPPSLSAGDLEMRDRYAPHHAPRPTLNQAPYLSPYLGLRARLSQTLINRWTILLILVLVRVLFAVGSIDDNLESARAKAFSACSSVEAMGSAMASMPHYMSQGVNELTATGVENAVNGLYSMLGLTVTGVEELAIFVVHMLTQTYLCLITLAVSGSLHAGLQLVSDAATALNSSISNITDDISGGINTFQDSINSILSTINGLPGVDNSIPTLDLNSSINALKDLKIPDDTNAELQKLNDSIPTFDQVQTFVDDVIRTPFDLIQGLINQSMSNYTFDRSVFPVPQKESLSFCSGDNGINDFFNSLVNLVKHAKSIFLGVIPTLAILAVGVMAWWEIKRYHKMQRRAQLIAKDASDPMDIVYLASRPHSSSFGLWLAKRSTSLRNQYAIRWTIAYCTSIPALFVLSLGVAGLFSCLCQYILLKAIEKQVPELAGEVGQFADKVVFALNNASESWANGTNAAILSTNDNINQEIFGWVNTTTSAINDTFDAFAGNMTQVLNDTFGGTVLYEPVKGVFDCLIGLKIESLQKGLTWVQDHAHIDFPLLPNDTFSIGAAASINNETATDNFLASPSSATTDEITEVVVSLTNKIAEGIRQEAIISAMLIVVWFLVFLIGLLYAVIVFFGRGKLRAEGGQAYVVDPETDNRRGHDFYPESLAPPPHYTADPPVNRAAPYTLQPRPFPTFQPSSENQRDPGDEKVSHVSAAHDVGGSVTMPTHLRSSSHGQYAATTPIDEKSNNPFADSFRL